MATTKVYQSFEEINRDLEILKVEKDLAYARFMKDFNETKDSITAENIIGKGPVKVAKLVGMFSGSLKSAALTWLFKKIF
jgi:Family of unknown function (DUF6327)